MTRRHKLLLYSAFSLAIYLFLLILAAPLIPTLWFSIMFIVILVAAIVQPFYLNYHFRHSDKKEKERVKSQREIFHHYYDRWYTPADSTDLDYQIERIKKKEKALGSKNLAEHYYLSAFKV